MTLSSPVDLPLGPATAGRTAARPPLLVVGHGTRSDEGVASFHRFIERLEQRLAPAGIPVAGGFIELAPPPLTDAVTDLVEAGHGHVIAVPLMLAAAGHAKGDIPGAMARELVRNPGLSYTYARPLGSNPQVLAALEQRLDEVLGREERAGTYVVLVGRGSTDPDANAEVAKAARLFEEGRGFAGVEVSFISLAEPSVPAALERCRRLGAERVVVLPYFMFEGVLPDRIVEQATAWADRHPELEVRHAPLIGDCDLLADLVVERYDEAIHGDIRSNCDTCMYRVAMPGVEHRVGQPQTPHDHPDDPNDPHGHHHDDHEHHAHGSHGHGHPH
ncbi:MAG: Sirohydrochlorin ferrochelatase [Frankiales bacterium]|nr:Sirohydrochlorin ferrochelatase [Frankiales bacterium]